MNEQRKSEFRNHQIVSSIVTEAFGTWLLKQPYQDGRGHSVTFWVRITAADGLLRVTGDFDPVVFAHGPMKPIQCVRWMAGRNEPDSYRMEKASIGMGGRGRVSTWDTELARKDLLEARDFEVLEEPYNEGLVKAIDEALDLGVNYDGEYGCHEYVRMIMDSEHLKDTDVLEVIGNCGRRPLPAVGLALRACNRLVELVDKPLIDLERQRDAARDKLSALDRTLENRARTNADCLRDIALAQDVLKAKDPGVDDG